ncbi:MAG: NAD-dependent epimerase/dehydratase family protein [Planctomycetes bacterium]|nr:NAD-dependent epimerase/dehydratase family protein [Planctomycetota bacterium]MBI3844963.1 NAD-dependent epimerase/dehydratase family protein [Planctomycetota bacterium]
MNVLITGGAGFLGSHLGDWFLQRGHTVYALDIASDAKIRHNLENTRFHFIPDSFLNVDILENLVAKCELIYHLGAVVGVEHYVSDPYKVLNVNVNGIQNILRLAHRYDRKVVFSSTSEVYGRNPKVPWKEDDDRVLGSTRIDRWCYSTSKAVGEHFCLAYKKMGLRTVILRYFNVYGPRLDAVDKGRVVTIFLGQLLRGQPITVVGNGSQTRSFTYSEDAIEATAQAGLRKEADGEIFNIGTDVETSMLELANVMRDVFGGPAKIEFVPQQKIYGNSYEDIQRRVPDVTRMKTILGVTPKVGLREGLRRTIEWFKESEGWIEPKPAKKAAAKKPMVKKAPFASTKKAKV